MTIQDCSVGEKTGTASAGLVLGAINEGNLVISNVRADGTNAVSAGVSGGLVGAADSAGGKAPLESAVITGCTVDGTALTVTGTRYAGGLLGQYALTQTGKTAAKQEKLSLLSNKIAADTLTVTAGEEAGKSSCAAGGLVGAVQDAVLANVNGCTVAAKKISITASGSSSDQRDAGGALGTVSYSAERKDGDLLLNRVLVGADQKDSSLLVEANAAGGLVGAAWSASGKTAPAVTVKSSTVQADTMTIQGAAAAGGLLARSTDISCKLTGCMVSSFVSSASENHISISALENDGRAGGMLGTASADVSTGSGSDPALAVSGCVVRSRALEVEAPAAAGGFLGSIQNLTASLEKSSVLSMDRAHLALGAAADPEDGSITVAAKAGTAGGFLADAENENGELGTADAPALVLSGSFVETGNLAVRAKNEAGGFAGRILYLDDELISACVAKESGHRGLCGVFKDSVGLAAFFVVVGVGIFACSACHVRGDDDTLVAAGGSVGVGVDRTKRKLFVIYLETEMTGSDNAAFIGGGEYSLIVACDGGRPSDLQDVCFVYGVNGDAFGVLVGNDLAVSGDHEMVFDRAAASGFVFGFCDKPDFTADISVFGNGQ